LNSKTVIVEFSGGQATITPSIDVSDEKVFLSPGWLDIQVNGFTGINLSGVGLKIEDLQAMCADLLKEGVSAWCPTLTTGPLGRINRNLRIISRACELDSAVETAIPGIHLEGPYISPENGARGAHSRRYVRPPDWEEFSRYQDAAGGRIHLVTLAPEQPNAIAFIHRAVRAGVVVAIGHTAAPTSFLKEAIDAGASLSTHLGNGIASHLHRHENPLWDQLSDDRLYASLIFDGFHLPANVMRVFLRVKGINRCVLISDATSLTHMPPGVYKSPFGGKVELHENGRLSLYGTEYLAGSANSLKDCIEVAMRVAGCTLAQAIQMASLNPWRLLNLPRPEVFTLFQWDAQAYKLKILAIIRGQKVTYLNRTYLADGAK